MKIASLVTYIGLAVVVSIPVAHRSQVFASVDDYLRRLDERVSRALHPQRPQSPVAKQDPVQGQSPPPSSRNLRLKFAFRVEGAGAQQAPLLRQKRTGGSGPRSPSPQPARNATASRSIHSGPHPLDTKKEVGPTTPTGRPTSDVHNTVKPAFFSKGKEMEAQRTPTPRKKGGEERNSEKSPRNSASEAVKLGEPTPGPSISGRRISVRELGQPGANLQGDTPHSPTLPQQSVKKEIPKPRGSQTGVLPVSEWDPPKKPPAASHSSQQSKKIKRKKKKKKPVSKTKSVNSEPEVLSVSVEEDLREKAALPPNGHPQRQKLLSTEQKELLETYKEIKRALEESPNPLSLPE